MSIGDAHAGLKAAIAKILGCAWQRCTVHFLRDCLGHARKDQPIFNADSHAQARDWALGSRRASRWQRAKVAAMLDDAETNVLAFYAFPPRHWRKLRSTNPLERFNREVGRRTDDVGIVPDDQRLVRLVGGSSMSRQPCAHSVPTRESLLVILGLILALASAVATNLAFLLKHRGAVLAPAIEVRHPLRSAAGLFRSRWFAVGWIVAIVAWGLHVGALSLAALSIVQAVLSGGLVFLAVLAERFFGFELGRRQWFGITITAAGLVVIGLTSGGAEDVQRASLAALIAIEGAIFALVGALVRISTRRNLPNRGVGLLLGAAAGALWGVSDVALKYLTQAPPGPVLGLVSPWTLTALIAGVIAFYASARSLQIGNGVEVIALTSVTANLIAIIGGILVFHEPIGSGAVGITARFLAFCLVIAGAALVPAPMRATPDAA